MISKNTGKTGTLNIPSREEFHRFASNLLSEEDFSTYRPANASKKTCNAICWTESHAYASRRNQEKCHADDVKKEVC